MKIPRNEDEEYLTIQCIEVAGEAVAAKMRGGPIVAGLAAIEGGGDNAAGVIILNQERDALWIRFAEIWARRRYYVWMDDQRDLLDLGEDQRAALLAGIQEELNWSGLEVDLIEAGMDYFGFWVIELEPAWPVVQVITDRLISSARGGGEPPVEDDIDALLDAVTVTAGDLLGRLREILDWHVEEV